MKFSSWILNNRRKLLKVLKYFWLVSYSLYSKNPLKVSNQCVERIVIYWLGENVS